MRADLGWLKKEVGFRKLGDVRRHGTGVNKKYLAQALAWADAAGVTGHAVPVHAAKGQKGSANGKGRKPPVARERRKATHQMVKRPRRAAGGKGQI